MQTFRLRTLLLILGTTFNRRWILHPWQVTIRAYLGFVAIVAAGWVVSGFPSPMIGLTLAISLATFVSLRLRWFGFSRADVSTLLAIIFVGTMLLLPSMVRTRDWTAGGRYFPRLVPASFMALIWGERSVSRFEASIQAAARTPGGQRRIGRVVATRISRPTVAQRLAGKALVLDNLVIWRRGWSLLTGVGQWHRLKNYGSRRWKRYPAVIRVG